MGLALDELKANDKKIDVEGFSFIMDSEVADTIRPYGNLFIDYLEQPWEKGFQLSFQGQASC
jgi:Fe-S cluster assembly iron-binding protein IscA